MARSLLNAKVVSAFVVDQTMGMLISRRGYSAAVKCVGREGGVSEKRAVEEISSVTSKEVAWIPDPVTGFYRPENMIREVDAAELRAELLSDKKTTSN